MGKNETTVWLMGGFGNVLFQLLAAEIIMKEGGSVKICTLLTENNIITKLLGWSVHEPIYELIASGYEKSNKLTLPLLAVGIGKVSTRFNKMSTFVDNDMQDIPKGCRNLFGYFQNKTLLEKYSHELCSFSDKITSKINENKENIEYCMHVRLGDSTWAQKNITYYSSAIEYVPKNVKVTIVTDSIEEAKKIFDTHTNIVFVKSLSALDDFKIISSAKNLICAPSTFSWWAAHCIDNPECIIVPEELISKLGFHRHQNKIVIL